MEILDWAKELLQLWLSDWLKLGIVVLCGIVMAWLKSKDWRWATPVLYGLVAAGAISVILSGATTDNKFKTATPKKIEETVRNWADTFNFGIKTIATTPDVYFRIVVTPRSGKNVQITHLKRSQTDLVLTANFIVGNFDREKLMKLSIDQQRKLVRELRIEMTKFRVGYSGIGLPLKAIYLERSIPIDDSFTQNRFFEAVGEVEGAILLASEMIALELKNP